MDHNLFYERLKNEIRKEREEHKEYMAQGYAKEDYELRVGILRGMDEVEVMCQKIIRSVNNGEE